MNDDIDNMTETEIDAEMRELHEIQREGKMTPMQARRLESLRSGMRSIRHAKKPVYWL